MIKVQYSIFNWRNSQKSKGGLVRFLLVYSWQLGTFTQPAGRSRRFLAHCNTPQTVQCTFYSLWCINDIFLRSNIFLIHTRKQSGWWCFRHVWDSRSFRSRPSGEQWAPGGASQVMAIAKSRILFAKHISLWVVSHTTSDHLQPLEASASPRPRLERHHLLPQLLPRPREACHQWTAFRSSGQLVGLYPL